MTIRLLEGIQLAGMHQAVGSILTLSPDAEARHVSSNRAVYTTLPNIGDNSTPVMASTTVTGGIGFIQVSGENKDITADLVRELSNGNTKLRIYGFGTAIISDTILLYDNTHLDISAGVTIKQAAGTNKTMFKSSMFAESPAPITITWTSGHKCTVGWTNHNKSVGDVVWIYGATQSQYRGVFYVESVVDQNNFVVSLKRNPTVAPTGSLFGVKANRNLRITCAGVIDYDYVNNAAATAVNKLAVVLGGAHVYVDGLIGNNALKYVLALGAVRDFCVNNFHSDTTNSDGIKVYGPAFDGQVVGLSGRFGDDAISFQTHEPPAYLQYEFTLGGGDILSVHGRNIYPSKTTTGVAKIYTSANELVDDVGFDGVSCTDCPGIQTSIYSTYDNANVGTVFFNRLRAVTPAFNMFKTIGNTGHKIKRLEINGVDAADTTAIPIEIGSGAVIESLNIQWMKTVIGNAYSVFLAGAIKEVNLYNCVFSGTSGAGRIVGCGSGVNVDMVNLVGNVASGYETLFHVSNTAGAPVVINARENVTTMPSLVQCGMSGSTVNIQGNKATGATSGMVRANNSANIFINDLGGNVVVSGSYLSRSGSEVVNINGHCARVDVTQIARLDGAIVYNTNAAAGTLGAAGLVVCQGTSAGSWKLLADTSKTY